MKLLDKILKDKTTGRNIVWATDAYNFLGGKLPFNQRLVFHVQFSKRFMPKAKMLPYIYKTGRAFYHLCLYKNGKM